MGEEKVRGKGCGEPGRGVCAVGIGQAGGRLGAVGGSALGLGPDMFGDIAAMEWVR